MLHRSIMAISILGVLIILFLHSTANTNVYLRHNLNQPEDTTSSNQYSSKEPESVSLNPLAINKTENRQKNETTNASNSIPTDQLNTPTESSNSKQSDTNNDYKASSETAEPQETEITSPPTNDTNEYWFESSYYGQSQEIVDQGYMVEWDDNWFVVHWYTDYGKQIQGLQPNDIVHINGRTVIIYGSFDIAYESYTEEIREEVGNDKVLFQTCYGPHQPTMLVQYGYYI